MVEKESIKTINYEDIEKLWKSNPFYNVNYSDLNVAIISDEKTFYESITDLLGSDKIISGFNNFFQQIKCVDETNERHFFQWISKYLIPLTLMNPESENYVHIYNSFWEESKSHCYTSKEEVANKSRFIMFLFTFSYMSNLLFKCIVTYEYENIKQFFNVDACQLSVCLSQIKFETTSSFWVTAQAVSSHDVSIASTFITDSSS